MNYDYYEQVYAGQAAQFDVTYDADVTDYTVVATVVPPGGGDPLLDALDVQRVDASTVRTYLSGANTTALAGRRVVVKVVATPPGGIDRPVVNEALLTVAPS